MNKLYHPTHPIRFITAASLFDGHDAAINIMRRLLQASGVEVIHLAHNRSVQEVVEAAIQEDVDGIAISSYQGGHVEYFKYLYDSLKQKNCTHIKIFGGGGGVIIPDEIEEIERYGIEKIYSPDDGRRLGLQGMIADMVKRVDKDFTKKLPPLPELNKTTLPRYISAIENGLLTQEQLNNIRHQAKKNIPVLGITGTGGAGKSSLTDELIRRFRQDNPDISIALIALDPTKRKTGGALLGDRIRMNAISHSQIFMRSLATRSAHEEVVPYLDDVVACCKACDVALVIVETPGIGQGDSGIVPHVDFSLYVMTPEFGAASQLEKIDMIDYADFIAINKCDRFGALDAIRDVAKQMQRSREAFDKKPTEMPVFGTIASHFNDLGVTALYQHLLKFLNEKNHGHWSTKLAPVIEKISSHKTHIVPATRKNYLNDVVNAVRDYKKMTEQQKQFARQRQQLQASEKLLQQHHKNTADFAEIIDLIDQKLTTHAKDLLQQWPALKMQYEQDEFVVKVRDKEFHTQLFSETLSGLRIRKVALPKYECDGEILAWLLLENLPGYFPYTAGVFPFKRENEDPSRMFAGEGDAFRTNKRFKYLSKHAKATRLSTAFDSVTLYGFDPEERPDIYGKVGNSGVSIATLDDMKALYDGFDLIAPSTSVSMTINGPAPTILAMFFNTAIDQQVDKFVEQHQRKPSDEEYEQIKNFTLNQIRGTVQADILKEDQGQNTCIFSTEFSLRAMADIQEYFVQHHVRNFYSVSISGYHIAEAGANPISQLAFTLANGFTYVETYLARGLAIDDFAHNLSFFFSNGMDAEYAVMGRVARRIWAITLRDKYGANSRSQKLKYHVQTSGRSLHAQEIDFNDIRTTLEALLAIYDNCNSLHTNAYDEATTTPTEESVRRAMAIQLIINNEFGVAKNENPLQGSFIMDELTELVEEAVLQELERLNERGGVLGAMETAYQRSKIQEESLYYENKKHEGSLPIVGVNTFLNFEKQTMQTPKALIRSTEAEKQSQLKRLRQFQQRHQDKTSILLAKLQQAAMNYENTFAVLMEAVKVCSLGQITQALFEVGGQYRRNM